MPSYLPMDSARRLEPCTTRYGLDHDPGDRLRAFCKAFGCAINQLPKRHRTSTIKDHDMKLARFFHNGSSRLGAVLDDAILDLSSAAPELPSDMIALLAAGAPALERVRDAVARGRDRIALSGVRLEAP